MPAEGVYAHPVLSWRQVYHSVTNIGRCHTFGQEEATVEVHLLDFEGDIYCENMRLDIIEFMRRVQRFDSAEALKEQIGRDVAWAREWLEGY
jgi:riboflavin kinase/FMN adenylyltransferase